MSSKKEYHFDPAIGEDVRWSESRRSWITRDGRRTGPPASSRSTATASGSTSGPSRSAVSTALPMPNAGRSSSGQVNANSDLERAMAQMNVGSPNTYPRSQMTGGGSSNIAGPAYPVRTQRTASSTASGPITQTLRDSRTGLETRWEVGAPSAFTDQAGHRRTWNTKRVRAVDKAKGPSVFRAGQVIEVHLVQLNHSAVSFITPSPNDSDSPTRVKRFVICNEQYQGDPNCFEACAIKTYNSEGVSAANVIKWHHTIIYTTREAPDAQANEAPGRGELPMQPQPIRVETWDRSRALDPMARLDYGTQYVFDRGVPNMTLFGQIDPNYLATFYSQLNLVQNRINAPPSSSGSHYVPSAPSVADSSATVTPASRGRRNPTAGPAYPAGRGVSARTQSGSSRNAPSAPSPPPVSGAITVDEMRRLVDEIRAHARERGLEVPGQLSNDQLRALAADANLRRTYFQRIRERWMPTADSDDDDEEEDDDDDDDDDDDRR